MPHTVNRPGIFKARVTEKGVNTHKDKVRLVCCYSIEQERGDDGEWYSVADAEMNSVIVGYHYLEKNDGSVNTVGVDQVKRALGWDGADLDWLNDTPYDGLVQIRVVEDEYDGKAQLKVNWLDHENAEPAGVQKADATELAAIKDKFGAKLRANSGGTARPGPAKPAAAKPTPAKTAPAKPAAAAKAGPPKRGAAAPTLTMDEAWAKFNEYCKAGASPMEDAAIQKEWTRLLEKFFPGVADDAITPEQWARFAAEATEQVIPF